MRPAIASTSPASSFSPKMPMTSQLGSALSPIFPRRTTGREFALLPKVRLRVDRGLRTVVIFFVLVFLITTMVSGAGVAPVLSESVLPESGQSGSALSIPRQSFVGVVTDTRCGAKHSAAIGDTASDCTLRCVRAGEQFILVDGESIHLLEGDPLALKRAAGQRVKIVGTLSGGKISVTSIVAP
jgi:hypothetical protein